MRGRSEAVQRSPGRTGNPAANDRPQARGDAGTGRSPYSLQYETIVAQGHERPTPSFGAPALIWHVAIWPRRMGELGEAVDPHDTAGEKHVDAKKLFAARRKAWVDQVREFLLEFQARGCLPGGGGAGSAASRLTLVMPHDLPWNGASVEDGDFFEPVEILEQTTAPFVLWWPDRSERSPFGACANAIRVCVHPEIGADYAYISFYMDIGQRWNEEHSAASDPACGGRRHRLLEAVADVRGICESQLEPAAPDGSAAIDLPALPETLRTPDQRDAKELHEALKAARNLLYVDIWELFCEEMVCRIERIAGALGEVFANFRGLVMSTEGLPEVEAPVYSPVGSATASVGSVTFPSFSRDDRFNADGAEANAVAKAFWPFVRRITPRADYREFVACGVLNWRAIYITALGSSSQYVQGIEREFSRVEEGEASIRVPPRLLEGADKPLAAASTAGHFDSLVEARSGRRGNNHPVRYLLLTKRAPHPRQIGRIAERINAMGTMRLYALKDWAAIRNADLYIRVLGQELDQITKKWSRDRKLINRLRTLHDVHRAQREVKRLDRFLAGARTTEERAERLSRFKQPKRWSAAELLVLRAMPGYAPRKPAPWYIRALLFLRFFYNWSRYAELIRGMENDLVADIRHAALYEISNEIETDLIDISSKLDELGFGAVGGLHFRLNRSAFYVLEFQVLLKTLQVQNIPSWVSYEQFVRRGLKPAFDYIASVGKRLRAVRARLLTTTETIETSALVGQSAATRHNTAVLRRTTTLAILIVLVFIAASSNVAYFATRVFRLIYPRLPDWLTTRIDWIWSMLPSIPQ